MVGNGHRTVPCDDYETVGNECVVRNEKRSGERSLQQSRPAADYGIWRDIGFNASGCSSISGDGYVILADLAPIVGPSACSTRSRPVRNLRVSLFMKWSTQLAWTNLGEQSGQIP